jgi:hypothetical protein
MRNKRASSTMAMGAIIGATIGAFVGWYIVGWQADGLTLWSVAGTAIGIAAGYMFSRGTK